MRIGVLLCGCGTMDGSDPTQTIALRIAASRRADLLFAFAPDRLQADVIGLSGPETTSRHALHESARLTGGEIEDVARVRADEIDLLVVVGGLGARKTLITEDGPVAAALAHELLDLGGALLIVDDAVAWAAMSFSAEANLKLAVGADPELESGVTGNGHRAVSITGELVIDDAKAVFSLALDPQAPAARVLDQIEAALACIDARFGAGTEA